MSYNYPVPSTESSTETGAPPAAGPRLLLALDKFKGTLTSREAADALHRGLARANPSLDITTVPFADGGDGTVEAAVSVGYRRRPFEVRGPVGPPVTADAAVRADVAVIEVASVCGLKLLPGGEPRPLEATSYGVGELLLGLAASGYGTVLLGLGGSATTDGGAGMLCALGARLLDAEGRTLPPGGAALTTLSRIDWSGLDPRLRDMTILVASDIDSPLLGRHGAARMFGPQKGADERAIERLEAGLGRLVAVLEDHPSPWLPAAGAAAVADEPGAGSAGGIGFGARLLGARIVSGAQAVMDLIGLRALIRASDLVITGEGCLDQQSLRGKAPVIVAGVAVQEGIPAVAVVGRNSLAEADWPGAGLSAVWSISEFDRRTAECPAISREVLELVGGRIARALTGGALDDWAERQRTMRSGVRANEEPPRSATQWEKTQCPS